MSSLNSLKEKIRALETEQAHLILEVEGLRKTAESRAAALESEVTQMRQEAKSLRELVGANAKAPAGTSSKTLQDSP